MGSLKVLSSSLANMIAAGEVVQRPSSVVKELMENAVDAGAENIIVTVSDAGRTLIQVSDNGCGMSPEDALLCFERHATSKISSESDLESIATYGFRGEALPSIASVSEVTLKTRRSGDELAAKVEISPSGTSTSSVSAPVGTSITVRNLFFNTPARRKFLKSDAVELKHIVEEFTRVALTRFETAFTLISNGREMYVLKPAKTLKFRVLDLMGSGVASELVDLHLKTDTVEINGFIGNPASARKTPGNQYFFVNGRFFRSAYFGKAVLKAYEGFIPEGVTPSYFLSLTLDPEAIDVNIHPTKTEVKFEDDAIIFQIIYACVKETLGRNAFGSSIDFDSATAVDMPSFGKNFGEYHSSVGIETPFDSSYNPFDEPSPASGGERISGGPGYVGTSAFIEKDQDYGRLFEERSLPSSKAMLLGSKYVAAPSKDGIMIVNIRRASERILYESFLSTLRDGSVPRQESLFPITVEVGIQNRLILENNLQDLSDMGFGIELSSDTSVTVSSVPEGFSCEETAVRDMLSNLVLVLSEGTSTIKQLMDAEKARKYALLGSSSMKSVRTPLEAQALIEKLLGCENPELTPSGHRILTVITGDEIEQKLK